MDYHFENSFAFVCKMYVLFYILYLMPWAIRNECAVGTYILYNNNYTHRQFNILKAHNYLNACILYMNTFLN